MDQRNDGLHPRHPGRGKPTSLIALEGDEAEVGGVMMFLPSGHHISIGWRSVNPINPTMDAAKKYAAAFAEKLVAENSDSARADLEATNWVSVVAAIQRIILDWNDGIKARISAEMFKRFQTTGKVH